MRDLERGFRRLTLLLSVVLALVTWFWFSEARLRGAEQKQEAIIDDASNYRRFWDCWDTDNFYASSRQMVVEDLLSGHDEAKMVPVPNGGDNCRVLLLVPQVVFPGIDDLRQYYHIYDPQNNRGILRIADSALEKAAQTAKAKCLAFEPYFSQHFVRSRREMMTRSIFEGVPVGAGAFGAMWTLFLLFKWISRGFHCDVVNTGRTPSRTDTLEVVPVEDGYDSRTLQQETVRNRAC